jgi:hypothetical protein
MPPAGSCTRPVCTPTGEANTRGSLPSRREETKKIHCLSPRRHFVVASSAVDDTRAAAEAWRWGAGESSAGAWTAAWAAGSDGTAGEEVTGRPCRW